jgi:osmotically-inducible protein OsmY
MIRTILCTAGISLGLTLGAYAQDAQTPPPDKKTAATSQSKSDRELTAKIRKALVDDKTLSARAHNITIVTKDGNVTLRGNVDSDAERDAVLAKAKEVAGSANITNDLTVKAPKTKKTTGE